ncbi:MAG: cache domain-containing protein [Spirochaetales bacterium]|nr:cache domain-containing protein [Spirochaetales bacterium]
MTFKSKILINIVIPFSISLFSIILIVGIISSHKSQIDFESSISEQNKILVNNIALLIQNSAKSFIIAENSGTTNTIDYLLEKKRGKVEIFSFLNTKRFLNNGYTYLVDTQGTITTHPESDKIGTESVLKDWLINSDIKKSDFYKYKYNDEDKIVYKSFNEKTQQYVLSTSYISDFGSLIDYIELNKYVNNLKVGKSGYPFIINTTGICISHPNPEYINSDISNLADIDGNFFIKYILAKRNGNFSYKWLNANNKVEKKMVFFSYDKNSDLIICSSGYINEYFESLYKYLNVVILISLIIFIITLIVIFKEAGKISTPISHLSELTLSITNGNLDTELIHYETQELEILSKNFSYMRDWVKESITKLENQVESRTQELQKTIDKLNNTQEHLIESEKMASLGQLVAGIAHEINTPIGIGVTTASLLEDNTRNFLEIFNSKGVKKSELISFLENVEIESHIILANMNRAANLIQSFKQLSVDQSVEETRHFNISNYINELIITLKHELKHKDIKIIINCDKELGIHSHPGAISQILTNLIFNSLLHGFEDTHHGIIEISIEVVDGRLYISYFDNGCGIPPEIQDKIFDPFFTTKRNKGGTGLGLHIVYNIIHGTLNGSVKCSSQTNVGTTFIIDFPLEPSVVYS